MTRRARRTSGEDTTDFRPRGFIHYAPEGAQSLVSLSDDITILALVGTWTLVIATIVLLYWQTRQTQQLHSANAVMTLRERFDSTELRSARKRTAAYLLNDTSTELPDLQVAAFFELMGAMVHRNVLDEKLVWDAFGGWISSYHYMIHHPKDRFAAARERMGDPLIFAEFEYLESRIERIDRQRLGKQYDKLPSPEAESRVILAREAALPLYGPQPIPEPDDSDPVGVGT